MVLLSSTVSFQILCLSICQLLTQRLSSPAVTVSLSISPCSSVGFCSTYFDALWLGSCTLRAGMSSWRINLFILNTLLHSGYCSLF